MMNSTQGQIAAHDIKTLYEATMKLYKNYFDFLEAALRRTPSENIETLEELTHLAEKANIALQDDLSLFEKVIDSDMEEISGFENELKIQAIYDNLKNDQ